MKFEEVQVGKKYLVHHTDSEVEFVTEILSEYFDKVSLESTLIHKPVFFTKGFSISDKRAIDARLWNALFDENTREVDWKTKEDCC